MARGILIYFFSPSEMLCCHNFSPRGRLFLTQLFVTFEPICENEGLAEYPKCSFFPWFFARLVLKSLINHKGPSFDFWLKETFVTPQLVIVCKC